MTAPALLCATLEVALNRTLRLEPAVLAELGRLSGRVLALHVEDLDWRFYIELADGGVRVLNEAPLAGRAPDVEIGAASAKLLGSALRMASGDGAATAGLRVSGDAELLQRFVRLLQRVGLDAEELLARVLPGPAAHRVAQTLQRFTGWGRRSAMRFAEDASEYLREETGDLAGARDVEEWMRDVESLRERVDRLEARLQLAERKHGDQP